MSLWGSFCRAIEAPSKIIGATILLPIISMGTLSVIKEYLHYIVPPEYLVPIIITSASLGCMGSSFRVTVCGRKFCKRITSKCQEAEEESDSDNEEEDLLTHSSEVPVAIEVNSTLTHQNGVSEESGEVEESPHDDDKFIMDADALLDAIVDKYYWKLKKGRRDSVQVQEIFMNAEFQKEFAQHQEIKLGQHLSKLETRYLEVMQLKADSVGLEALYRNSDFLAEAEKIIGSAGLAVQESEQGRFYRQPLLLASSRPHRVTHESDSVITLTLSSPKKSEKLSEENEEDCEDPAFNQSDTEDERRRSKRALAQLAREF